MLRASDAIKRTNGNLYRHYGHTRRNEGNISTSDLLSLLRRHASVEAMDARCRIMSRGTPLDLRGNTACEHGTGLLKMKYLPGTIAADGCSNCSDGLKAHVVSYSRRIS